MRDLQQKVAYVQGLSDGLDLENSKEGRIISEMLGILEGMADYIDSLQEQLEDMEDYIESIDSDLSDVEDEIFGDEEEGGEDDMVDVECPNCHEQVCFDSAILYDDDLIEVTCPNCNAVVFVNDGSCDGCECECGCEEGDTDEAKKEE